MCELPLLSVPAEQTVPRRARSSRNEQKHRNHGGQQLQWRDRAIWFPRHKEEGSVLWPDPLRKPPAESRVGELACGSEAFRTQSCHMWVCSSLLMYDNQTFSNPLSLVCSKLFFGRGRVVMLIIPHCLTCVEGASAVPAGCANMLGSQESPVRFFSQLGCFSKDSWRWVSGAHGRAPSPRFATHKQDRCIKEPQSRSPTRKSWRKSQGDFF